METRIAKAFIVGNRRERFLFDRMKKDPLTAIFKLPSILDSGCVLMSGTSFPATAEVVRIMQSHGVTDSGYIISEYRDEGFDGQYVPLLDAIEKVRGEGFPALIVGLPSGFSCFKEESVRGNQPYYFLKPRLRFDGAPKSDTRVRQGDSETGVRQGDGSFVSHKEKDRGRLRETLISSFCA